MWGSKSSNLARGLTKSIAEDKLKAFNIGNMNLKKSLSKREQDDEKKKRDQEEAINAYKDFVESFEDSGKAINKSWVKGGVVNPDKSSKGGSNSSRIYKPTSKLAELASTFSSVKKESERERDRDEEYSSRKPGSDKKKTNLEMFKDELKNMQEERQQRRQTKSMFGLLDDKSSSSSKLKAEDIEASLKASGSSSGGYTYVDDVQTTNIYLGNINPKMTEQQLCEEFGRHGPLASVKVMWPRSEEERARNRNCGFVAFMNRRDAERAMADLEGRELMNFEMKLGWGKAVPIPPHPVYIPPSLAELTMPPPPSGLPFNAQPKAGHSASDSFEKTLAQSTVKVVIPTERNLVCIIHHMIEFVVREGPMFEAMIMNKELNNPLFRFLFENQSPAHIYYRWKLFSILQGESTHQWRTEPFVMFKGGSLWQPPPVNPYTQGMPEELVKNRDSRSTNNDRDRSSDSRSRRHEEEELEEERTPDSPSEQRNKRGQLSESQRDRLEDMLRDLTPERSKIGDAMVWCLEHADAAEEIVECISESLSILQTPLPKKIARLFLVSDILHNSSVKIPHVSSFRRHFEPKLAVIMKDIRDAYKRIDARLKAEQFKQRVMMCFRAWEDWAIYPNDLLIYVQNIFLDLISGNDDTEVKDDEEMAEGIDLDGVPLSDIGGLADTHDDIDGKPLDDFTDLPSNGTNSKGKDHADKGAAKFKAAEMAHVDESLLIQQAVTSSKWDFFEQGPDDDNKDKDDDDIDGMPMEDETAYSRGGDADSSDDDSAARYTSSSTTHSLTNEERRIKLREIELKVA